MNTLGAVITAVLVGAGLVDIIQTLIFSVLKGGGKLSLTVTPESGEDCEHLLRSAEARLRWMRWRGPVELICVNEPGDSEIDRICGRLQRDWPFLKLRTCGEHSHR